MSRHTHPAGEVAPLDSHSRNQSRMRHLTASSRCESRITEGRRSRNLTSAVQDMTTLQLVKDMTDSHQKVIEKIADNNRETQNAQTELIKRAMDERAEEARLAKNERKELMDKCLELATRSRQPTPQPGFLPSSRAVELSEQLRPP